MLPDTKPPQDVIDLVNQYKSNPTKFELVIHDSMFFLYEIETIVPEDKSQPTRVIHGPFIKRAYWSGGLSSDMMKARLGIR